MNDKKLCAGVDYGNESFKYDRVNDYYIAFMYSILVEIILKYVFILFVCLVLSIDLDLGWKLSMQ